MKKNTHYIIIALFSIAILTILIFQIKSTQSYNSLLAQSEVLNTSYKTNESIAKLSHDVIALRRRFDKIINDSTAINFNTVYNIIDTINLYPSAKEALAKNKMFTPLINKLDSVVYHRVDYFSHLIYLLETKGKDYALSNRDASFEKSNANYIRKLTKTITEKYDNDVLKLMKKRSQSEKNTRLFSNVIALIAVFITLLSFGFVMYKVHEQQKLIQRLNISELKAKESAKIKESFLANISHEIRTPLNAIMGFTDELLENIRDKEPVQHLQFIKVAGHNLLQIVNDVLDYSRLEAGKVNIANEVFSLSDIIKAVENTFKAKAREKNISFKVVAPSNLPEKIYGDPVRLNQILINIINNAIKFTNCGTVQASFQVKQLKEDNMLLLIFINDTGIGIPQKELKSVFERFHQADNNLTRKYGGSGLGLSIVKNLLILMSGTIDIRSKEGMGTSVKVTIPYMIAHNAPAAEITESNTRQPLAKVDIKEVLIAEDNEINKRLIQRLLEKIGLLYSSVNNGTQAIEAVDAKSYDLILMDIQMPETDGLAATQAIRKKGCQTPIIGITAHVLPGEKAKCLAHGMNDYISKPIDRNIFYAVIEKYIETLPVFASESTKNVNNQFKYLDTAYLKSISGGDHDYEKEVVELFLKKCSSELLEIECAIKTAQHDVLKKTIHSFRSTIAIAGLLCLLEKELDTLEFEDFAQHRFSEIFKRVKSTSQEALKEMNDYYRKHSH